MRPEPGSAASLSTLEYAVYGYAYEVLLDEQQVALGSIPDVGLRRSFANRDVDGPEGKHQSSWLPTKQRRSRSGHRFQKHAIESDYIIGQSGSKRKR
jgi:hypothetical protein